jgi:replication factor A1
MTTEEAQPAVFKKLGDLRPDTAGHNLTVKVVEAKLVHTRQGRPGAAPARIAECLVGDDSGVMVITARNDQVDQLQPGSCWTLRNAKVDMYRGCMRLAVDQFGKLEPADGGAAIEPKTDFNLSLVEYELVNVPAEAS